MSVSTSISNKGILIQYDFCTGCHACEVACKKDKGLALGEYGIKIMQYGPAKLPNGRWDYFYVPVPTELCDQCLERVEMGKLPACVHNCQAKVMEYGPLEDLVKKMVDIKKCVLFSPGEKE